MKTFKAKFLDYHPVKAASYGGTGYVSVYWFQLNLENGWLSVLPIILDHTVLYEPDAEFLAVLQPLRTYKKSSTDSDLIGTECSVKAKVNKNGFPKEIVSVEPHKSN